MKKYTFLLLAILLSTFNASAQKKTKVACIGNSVTFGYGHENPDIKLLYSEFFGEPGSHKAHELLHTHYIARDKH